MSLMQNVETLEAHGYKKVEGCDDEGNRVIAWMRNTTDRIGFAMCPDAGDTLPYIVDLKEWGFKQASITPQSSEGERKE